MTDCKNLDLARQWADGINAGVPVLAQAGHRAAAEVIRDLPDSWVDAERLREVVADHHIDMSEELMEALGALLPAPTPPTLADMTPEERAECQWMQADLKGGRIIIGAIADGGVNYIKQDGKAYWDSLGSGAGEIVPLPDFPRMEWPGNEPGNVPEFDPAYTYRDRDGDEWPYVAGGWRWGGDVFSRPHSAPPAKYGPYTRIEDTK